MAGQGVVFEIDGVSRTIDDPSVKRTLVRCGLEGDTVEATWSCAVGGRTVSVEYTLALEGLTLALGVRQADAFA